MKNKLNHHDIDIVSKLNSFLVVIICTVLAGIPQLNISGYVNSTITSKLVWFLYGCLIIFAFFAFGFFVSKKVKLSLTSLDIGLFALLIYITLNRYVFQATHGFSIRYIELLGLSVLYLILRTITLKSFYWILLVIVCSGIIQAVYGNLQLLGYYPSNHSGFKMTGSFFNPGPYAGFLAIVWSISLGMYLFKEKIINQVQNQLNSNSQIIKGFTKYSFEYIPLLGIISILLVIPASQSRASWSAVMVSTIILLEYKYAFSKKVLRKIGRLKKVILVVSATIILGIGMYGVFHFKKASADGRLFIWKLTTEMVTDTPIIGVGFDRFKAHYMNYQAKYFQQNGQTQESLVADNTYYAFNEGLQFLSENGVIGFILLSIVIYLIFKQPLGADYKYLAVLLKVCLLSIVVFGCFSYPMQILPIKLVLMAVLALLSSLSLKKYEVVNFNEPIKKWLFKGLVLVAGIGGCFYSFAYTRKLDKGFVMWKEARYSFNHRLFEISIDEYESTLDIFDKNGSFLQEYGRVLSLNGNHNEAVENLEKAQKHTNSNIMQISLGNSYKSLGSIKKAEEAYKKSANMIPSLFYPQYLLAKLYCDSGQKNKALKKANEILQKDIKIHSKAITEMKLEMKKIAEKYKNL